MGPGNQQGTVENLMSVLEICSFIDPGKVKVSRKKWHSAIKE